MRMQGLGLHSILLANTVLQEVGKRKLTKEKDKAPELPGLLSREARAEGTGAPREVCQISLTPVASAGVR
jgi:hypothetical protein